MNQNCAQGVLLSDRIPGQQQLHQVQSHTPGDCFSVVEWNVGVTKCGEMNSTAWQTFVGGKLIAKNIYFSQSSATCNMQFIK